MRKRPYSAATSAAGRAGPPEAPGRLLCDLDALTEPQINRIGYALLARKRIDDAIVVFRHNADRFPQSANVHDSLGEAWMAAGNRANAIASYRRSLELDPQNANAAAMLEKLRSAM